MARAAERMSRVDTAWLRMDTEANLMMIVGVWLLEPPIAYEALCRRVEERLLKYARFRQKAVEDPLGATWVHDAAFDIRRHVLRESLQRGPRESARHALQRRVAELAAEPLDRDRPLWQIHLIDRYDDAGEGSSAMIARIHHCIADGIALISVMMSMVDGGLPPPRRARRASAGAEAEDGTGGATGEEGDGFLGAALQPIAALAAKALELPRAGLLKSIALLANPQQSALGSLDVARVGARLAADLSALARMPDDSRTRLKGRPGAEKRVAWSEPLPLDPVKGVGKALGCSVNDVLLASVAGAIGSYLAAFGDATAGQEIRAMVPVNLRPPAQAHQLGNRFGLVPLSLPIGLANPVERVYALRERMRALKGSYQPLLAFGMLSVAGLLAKPVQAALLNLFAKKATAVMTNVPGPPTRLAFCGSTLAQAMFWVPQSGDIGVGVSILSYGGAVQFGLITDSVLCPDPEAVIERFAPEFEKLLTLTLMLPWAGEAA